MFHLEANYLSFYVLVLVYFVGNIRGKGCGFECDETLSITQQIAPYNLFFVSFFVFSSSLQGHANFHGLTSSSFILDGSGINKFCPIYLGEYSPRLTCCDMITKGDIITKGKTLLCFIKKIAWISFRGCMKGVDRYVLMYFHTPSFNKTM